MKFQLKARGTTDALGRSARLIDPRKEKVRGTHRPRLGHPGTTAGAALPLVLGDLGWRRWPACGEQLGQRLGRFRVTAGSRDSRGETAGRARDRQIRLRRQFITQLPGFLKTPLLAEPPRLLVMEHEAFIQHIGAALEVHASEAERALTSVWSVLRKAISAGEMADFQARVPKDVGSYLARVE